MRPYGKTKNMGSLVLPSMWMYVLYILILCVFCFVCVCVLLLFMLSLVGDYSCLIFRGQFTYFFFGGVMVYLATFCWCLLVNAGFHVGQYTIVPWIRHRKWSFHEVFSFLKSWEPKVPPPKATPPQEIAGPNSRPY